MKNIKRIFSVLMALALAFTAVPLFGVEAEASLGGLVPTGTQFSIIYDNGDGGVGSAYTDGPYSIESGATLRTASECGFTHGTKMFDCWAIAGRYYESNTKYTFSESDARKNDVGQYVVTAVAIWRDTNDSGKDTNTITGTFKAGEGEGRDVRLTFKYSAENKTYVVTLPGNTFTYKNHEFQGWKIAGYDGLYQPGFTFGIGESFTATAEWKQTGTEGVTVNDPNAIKSIAIKTKPKTSYKIGDTLTTEGLVLTVTKADGKTEDVSSGFTVSPAAGTKFEKADRQTITVTYKGKTTTYNITITDPSVSSAPASSKPASSKPASSAPASSAPSTSESVPESTSSETSSEPVIEEPEVFEPISLAYTISGDVPVTGIEFLLKEDIGENPQLRVAALDGNSATDDATAKFIASGDALAAFDLSLLVDGLAYHDSSEGTVNYTLNGTQANSSSEYESYVLGMAHVTSLNDYEGEYYMTDGENVYLYNPETDFKTAVANVALVEEDGVYRLVIRDVSGLSSFAYQAAPDLIVEVNLVPSASAATASIDVASLSPVLLVQFEVGEGKSAGAGIPFWVWIIIGVVVLLIGVLVALYLINRRNEERRFQEVRSRGARTSSGITGFDEE